MSAAAAYSAKAGHDLAIRDFSEAIWLDPKVAVAFNSRGYNNKGDYDHAIPDSDEAVGELCCKSPSARNPDHQR